MLSLINLILAGNFPEIQNISQQRVKVIFIESADPGYDYLFTKGIGGLITLYGGANSHMAIRCAEFNIPAAIGCGQAIYDLLSGEKMVEIDCAGEIVRPCAAH